MSQPYGNRIIYDATNGNVLYGPNYNMLGEMSEAADGLRPTTIDFIDLPYGDTTLQNAATYHIDPTTKSIVIDTTIPPAPPSYQALQQELLQLQGVI